MLLIDRIVAAYVGLFRLLGFSVLPYVLCNVGLILGEFFYGGVFPTFMLLMTAIMLVTLPREKLRERRTPWTEDLIAQERVIVIAAIVLHAASCMATLAVLWIFLMYRHEMLLHAGVSLAIAVAVGTWGWFRARRRWGEYGI